SPVRLAMHLGMALFIYAAMLWIALDLRADAPSAGARYARRALSFAVLVFVMALSGALVAGIHAGSPYNTFPTMNGHWVPDEILMVDPWWMNVIYNMATVQFDHRVLALAVTLSALALAACVWRESSGPRGARAWAGALLAAVAVQVSLGIATLLLR